jgi:hypothetical protein
MRVAAGVLLLVLAPVAHARTSADVHRHQVVFLVMPTTVTQGATLKATVSVSPKVGRCSGTLRRGDSGTTKYVPVRAGRATFSWQIVATATPGLWKLGVSCGRAGSASTTFTVVSAKPAAVAARVAVEKSGFSVRDSYGTRYMAYGIVLRNLSPDQDAIEVEVVVNAVDANNRILESDSARLEAIPAVTTYYLGDYFALDLGATPAKLEISVRTEAGRAKSLVLPPVANLRATDFYGDTQIAGEFSNPYTKPTSSLARITAVVFDAAGNVIGGGYTYPQASVAPGERIGFEITAYGVNLALVGSIQASVEPETT